MKTIKQGYFLITTITLLLIALSCSDNWGSDKKNVEEISPHVESSNLVGFLHNKALEIFYRDEMDFHTRQLIGIASQNNTDAFILQNEAICIDLLETIGEKVIKEYNDYFTKDELDEFIYKQREIRPSLLNFSTKNPQLNTPEVFLLYCKNENLLSDDLFNIFNVAMERGTIRTRSSTNLSLQEESIIDIFETVYGYSTDFWNQHNSIKNNATRIKGSTVRGAVYDAIGAGIGAAISGGTASFLLGMLFSAMQNEFGEETVEEINESSDVRSSW
ncbi:MAG: hypothetical protein GXZ19_05615 [Bacteroidales bacterium]|nr:hypothetical protein [Bacteroidales bacterium]